MNWQQVRDDWPTVSERIKAEWTKLSARDLVQIGGRRSELIRRVRQRYGLQKKEVAKAIEFFVRQLD